MNPQEQALLDQLQDVALPATPGIWPLAVGWYVVAALVLLAVLCAVSALVQLNRKKNQDRWRQVALADHAAIRKHAGAATNTKVLSDLSVLMRRVALAVLPRSQVAGITDDEWLHALDKLHSKNSNVDLAQDYRQGVGQLLYRAPYRASAAQVSETELTQLLDLTETTIRKVSPLTSGEANIVAL